MRILILTNEYPPHIYGGAGVHVEHLTRELAAIDPEKNHVEVLCFGDQDTIGGSLRVEGIGRMEGIGRAKGIGPSAETTSGPGAAPPLNHLKLIDALGRNLMMTGRARAADVIHCHTWYTHLAGCLLKQTLQAPLALTTHSLEPHRPWKKDQLGTGYHATTWIERTAMENADGVIAVSEAMKRDTQAVYGVDASRIQVIYNGIDVDRFKKIHEPDVPRSYGIDPSLPYVLFVGRVTRQKGILHLVEAIPQIKEGAQVVLCAGAPDTPAIGEAMAAAVDRARARTKNRLIWIPEMVPVPDLIALYSHASLFVCPSVYEPFGIINLEAMACRTPVVAAAVGGIPEVVEHEKTGLLVPFEPIGPENAEPASPERYAADLAEATNQLMADPDRLNAMGIAARERVEKMFSWKGIARRTLAFYHALADGGAGL